MARKTDSQHGEYLTVTIAALATEDVIGSNSASVASRDGRVGAIRVLGEWAGTAGDGRDLAYGISAGHLTDTEVEKILEQTPDRPRDTEMRLGYARVIGNIADPGNFDPAAVTRLTIDSGWLKMNMEFLDEDPIYKLFILNLSTSAVTTGGTLRAFVQSLLSWKALS